MDDEKDYSKTFDDGFTFNGIYILKVDKLPTKEEEFTSQCITNATFSVGGLYTDDSDQERYIRDRYQVYLKTHEKKMKSTSESHVFFKFKTWKEYCDRRFRVAEENTYCRVMTE